MRLALIGTGKIVEELLTISHDLPHTDLVALVGRRSGRVQQLQQAFGIGKGYTDYDQCLADAEVEVVYLGLPNQLHYEFARRALEAGKHVICEKPFTTSVEHLAQLRELAQRRGLILVEAITTTHLANYRAIQQRLPELGEIKLVQCSFTQYSSRYDAFKRGQIAPAFDPAQGGGALLDLGIYAVHFIVGLLGTPTSVHYAANRARGVDTSGVLTLAYPSTTAVAVFGKDADGPSRSSIHGERGTIVMDGPPNSCAGFSLTTATGTEFVDRSVHPHRMYEEFRCFEELIARTDLAAAEAGLKHSQAVLGVALEALGQIQGAV